MKAHQNLCIGRALSDGFDVLATKLSQRATRKVNDSKVQLDRTPREISGCRRDVGVVLEEPALFKRHQLTVTPPPPTTGALAAGSERSNGSNSQLGRQTADDRRTIDGTVVSAALP